MGHLTRWWADAFTFNVSLYFHAVRVGDLLHLLQPGYNGWAAAVYHFFAAAFLEASFLVWWSVGIGLLLRKLNRNAGLIALGVFSVLLFLSPWGTTTTTRVYQGERFIGILRGIVPTMASRALFILLPVYVVMRGRAFQAIDRRVRFGFAVIGVLLLFWLHPELPLSLSAGRIRPTASIRSEVHSNASLTGPGAPFSFGGSHRR